MQWSIRKALIMGIICLQIVTVGSILYSSYYSTEKTLISYAQKLMEMQVKEVIERSRNFLQPAQDAAKLTKRLAKHSVVSQQNPDNMKRYFFEHLRIHPQFTGVFFGSSAGDFVHVQKDPFGQEGLYQSKVIQTKNAQKVVQKQYHDEEFRNFENPYDLQENYDPRTRPWYKKAAQQKKLIWTDPYIFYSSRLPGITTAMSVMNDQNEFLGVVGVDISISQISNFLSQLKIGTRGKSFIISDQGQMIAYPDQSKIQVTDGDNVRFAKVEEIDNPTLAAVLNHAKIDLKNLKAGESLLERFTYKGEKQLVLLTKFPHQNWSWIIGVYIPEDEVLGTFKANQQTNLMIGGIIALAACFFSFFFVQNITNPILKLQQSAKKIGEGDLNFFQPEYSSFRELNQAQEVFATMVESLRKKNEENTLLTETLRKTSQEVVTRLSSAAEFKDDCTAKHIQRMASYCEIIALELGLSKKEARRICEAAKMHDIGKIGIPDEILNKPGKLNQEEWRIMRQHPTFGAHILNKPKTKLLETAHTIALTHHERVDGLGYPSGLAGEEIPLEGRIVSVADVFDALTSRRPYKDAFSVKHALEIINDGVGTQFDEKVVAALIKRLDDILKIQKNNLDENHHEVSPFN